MLALAGQLSQESHTCFNRSFVCISNPAIPRRDYRAKNILPCIDIDLWGKFDFRKTVCVKYNTQSKIAPQMMLWSSLPCGVQAKVSLDSMTAAQFWLLHLPSARYWDWRKVSANSDDLKRTPIIKIFWSALFVFPLFCLNLNLSFRGWLDIFDIFAR